MKIEEAVQSLRRHFGDGSDEWLNFVGTGIVNGALMIHVIVFKSVPRGIDMPEVWEQFPVVVRQIGGVRSASSNRR